MWNAYNVTQLIACTILYDGAPTCICGRRHKLLLRKQTMSASGGQHAVVHMFCDSLCAQCLEPRGTASIIV